MSRLNRNNTLLGLVLLTVIPCSVAQVRLDFSGVFVRMSLVNGRFGSITAPPIVLFIQQAGQVVNLTAEQNGSVAEAHYTIGEATQNLLPSGLYTKDRVNLKQGTLLIESDISLKTGKVRSQERWQLSPDSQTLTIARKFVYPNVYGGDIHETENYSRRVSREAAESEAAAYLANSCARAVGLEPTRRKNLFDGAAHIGTGGLLQLGRSVVFEAEVVGDVFDGLKRSGEGKAAEFQKNGKPLTVYPDAVTVEIQPTVLHGENRWNPHVPWQMAAWPIPSIPPFPTLLPEDLRTLRFRARWLGDVARDLGEVPAELVRESWPELRPPNMFYRFQIASQGVPFTDALQIEILSSDGKLLACITGHI